MSLKERAHESIPLYLFTTAFLVKSNNDRMSCATCRVVVQMAVHWPCVNHAVPLSDQNKSSMRDNFIIVLGTFNVL